MLESVCTVRALQALQWPKMNHAQRTGHLIRTSSKREKTERKEEKKRGDTKMRSGKMKRKGANGEKQTRTRRKLIGKSGQKIKYKS